LYFYSNIQLRFRAETATIPPHRQAVAVSGNATRHPNNLNMGFFFRKSLGTGLFRLNFSKSGVSLSTGIKGARVNFSSRGTYVNFGSHGIYYRKKISGFGQKGYTNNPTNYTPTTYEQHTITSSDVEEITDTDSQEFINELTEKGKKISYVNWFGILPLIITVAILFYSFFSKESTTKSQVPELQITETKDFIKSISSSNANIRKNPDKTSTILGVVNPGEKFELIDANQTDWYKISFNGKEGYVSKKFSEKTTVTTPLEVTSPPTIITNTSISLFDKDPSLFWIYFTSLAVFFSILFYYLKKADNKRLLVEIYYEIDENIKEVYEKFVYHFSGLLNCSRVWQYLHSQRTNDYKYSSGAAHTITRKPLSKISTNKTPSKIFRTNVQIPYLGLINTELYFFPERLIIKRGNEYGAIMYKNVECFSNITRFIESEGVPSDSEIVGHTWRYLNKNGSPDRRFNNNRQIPICLYSEYSLQSNSGLNEKISTSKVGGIDEFLLYIKAIGHLQKNIPVETKEENNKTQSLLD
jgi:hypothetical protein